MRYFFKEAAGTPLKVAGEYLRFEPVGTIAGSILGVIAVTDELGAEIDKIAKRFGIQEIQEGEYQNLVSPKLKAVFTRDVNSMAPVLQQPAEKEVKKVEPVKGEPRAVVKVGKG